MTNKDPGLEAPEKGNAEDAPFESTGKEPREWLRETPMGRQEICDEVTGLPDHYIQAKDGKRIPVPVACTKAVLRCLMAWDKPGSKFFRSNYNIAHCTGWPVSMVNKANLVLKQAGLLKKHRQGWDDPSVSELDWDLLQRYRHRYIPKRGLKEKLPTPSDDDAREDDVEQAGAAVKAAVKAAQPVTTTQHHLDPLTGEVFDRLTAAGFHPPRLAKLPPLEVDRMMRQVHTPLNEAALRAAISRLDKSILAHVLLADNPVGYLRKVLMTGMKEGIEVAVPEPEGVKQESEEEKRLRLFAEGATLSFAAHWNRDHNKPLPEFSHLVPAFHAAIINEPKGKWMVGYINFAFWKDEYFRKVSLNQAANTFLRQLPQWIARCHNELPDDEKREWEIVEPKGGGGSLRIDEDEGDEDEGDEEGGELLWDEETDNKTFGSS